MNDKEEFFISAGTLLPGRPSDFSAAISDVPDTTGIFDEDAAKARPLPVPGFPGDRFVPWGFDNQLPFDIIRLVGSDEVTAQNKLFNVLTCYGAGLQFFDPVTQAPTTDGEVKAWALRQGLHGFFLEQATDMKYFFTSVVVFILSRDGRRINRIRHKDMCYCRFAKADRKGCIPYVYYADWRDGMPAPGEVERIGLLDAHAPLGHLLRLMGREPYGDGRPKPPVKARKFAMLLRFPTAGNRYYSEPYGWAIFRGGSFDEKRLISVGKRAKLRNHSSVKFQVEVEKNYWTKICREENITDPLKRIERIRREKENIRDFVAGLENAGKVWISTFYHSPDGQEVHDIVINKIDSGKEGGDWNEDVQAAANTVCYADNVHPNLVGAVPGKSQSNNSGSDKRELFVMKQALEIAFHDILLHPLRIVCAFNGWDVEPTVPMIQLTTLDEHKDSKKVAVRDK